jgi:competence protein ComEC
MTRPDRLASAGESSAAGAHSGVSQILIVSLLLITGVWLEDQFPHPLTALLALTTLLVVVAMLCSGRSGWRTQVLMPGVIVILLGMCRWSLHLASHPGMDLLALTENGQAESVTVRLAGRLASIPAVEATAAYGPGSGTSGRTVFLFEARWLLTDRERIPVRGLCRASIQGDATGVFCWGDQVEMLGRLDVPASPTNPGEFDFATHLRRRGFSALMYVDHPAAVRIVNRSELNPKRWLNQFRLMTVAALKQHLTPQSRATAEALLLGNRGHLSTDLERDFISSGTMHLLAISGLHVGILYVFLVRLQTILLMPRTRALVLAGFVCVMYCLLTDLRPSVMRATVFILLHILGQSLNREVRAGSLIGATAVLLIFFDPSIVFDVGAWLSFLAVAALGWVSEKSPPPQDQTVPVAALTWRDHFTELREWGVQRLAVRQQQMLAVTLLSAPLIAQQFHMVSLIGMLINLLLIPFTTLTLICGYVFVFVAACLPLLATAVGSCFQLTLQGMNAAVSFSAGFRSGYITLPDLPAGFLPAYFLLLLGSATVHRSDVRLGMRLLLLMLVSGTLIYCGRVPARNHLTCTTLNVGHGNAVIAEMPDQRVLLFDAGALHRGERTADVISRFLWNRGYQMIDAIVISHPDADHYNAVRFLLDRIPVGQVVLSGEFVRTGLPDTEQVIELCATLRVPVVIAQHGDQIQEADWSVRFLQARLPKGKSLDNASSLVAVLKYRNQTICLPGDLEGAGAEQLLADLPQSAVLVSPHHGSLGSNDRRLAEQIRPQVVVVSSRDDRSAAKLQDIYADAQILHSSRMGAIQTEVLPDGRLEVETYCQPPQE